MAPGMETAFRLYRYLDVIAVFWILILDNSKQRAKIGWMKTMPHLNAAHGRFLGRRNIGSPSPEHQYQFQTVGSADHGHAHDCPEGVSHDRPDHPYRHQPGHLWLGRGPRRLHRSE